MSVEIDGRLASQCRDGAQRRRHAGGNVEFICARAQTYLHPDTTVVFMFHPFGAGTLREVIGQIDDALSRRPRRLRVVYFNPVFDEVLQTSKHLRPSEHWPQHAHAGSRGGGGGDYAVSFWASTG